MKKADKTFEKIGYRLDLDTNKCIRYINTQNFSFIDVYPRNKSYFKGEYDYSFVEGDVVEGLPILPEEHCAISQKLKEV
jgi:hypothetical protein